MVSSVIEEDVKVIAEGIKEHAPKLEGKTVLITGGAGFLGKYFILVLDYLNKNILAQPCKIISVDNMITGSSYPIEESDTFKPVQHNIIQPFPIEEPVHFIMAAAGIASPIFYRKHKIETLDVGYTGVRNMLEVAKDKKAESIVFFSSSEVYGDPDPSQVPTKETYNGNVSCTGPRSNYDESKRVGEALCVAYFQEHNVPVKMVRPFNVYGPGLRLDDFRVVPNFVAHAMKGKPIPVYGEGTSKRTFCYVTDAAIGFFKILFSDANGEAFNVGNADNEISMYAMAEIVAANFEGAKIEKVKEADEVYKAADPKRRCPDLTKIKEAVGYDPKVSVEEGVKRFITWAKELA